MNVRGGQLKTTTVSGDRMQYSTSDHYQVLSRLALHQVRENMWGTVDGTNKSYTLSQYPYEWSLAVYRNGSLQDTTDYSIIGKSVIFSTAPTSVDKVAAVYAIGQLGAWSVFPANALLGNIRSCMLDSFGAVWGWGGNGGSNDGYIGDNSTTARSSPVSVKMSGRFQYLHCAWTEFYENRWVTAIDENGQVWWWGQSTSDTAKYPANTNLGGSSPTSIARPGSYSKCGLGWAIESSTGMVFMWGMAPYGIAQAYNGDNTTTGRSSPVSIARSSSYVNVARIDGFSSYAIDSDGTLWSWGVNTYGNLGIDSTDSQSSPVSVLITSVKQVQPHITQGSYGIGGGCVHAIDSVGQIWGWGNNVGGMIGDNSTTNRSSPVSLARAGSYSQMAFCPKGCVAIDGATGYLWSWGGYFGLYGIPGNGTTNFYSSPVSVYGGRSYTKVVGPQVKTNQDDSLSFFLAIDGSTGMIYGWGQNSYGVLGDNTTTDRTFPTPITRQGSYKDITIMYATAFAVDAATNEVFAWGYNSGWFGNGDTANRSSPVAVARVFY